MMVILEITEEVNQEADAKESGQMIK